MTKPWWQDAVIYQVYLRSFADSDGDGIGDLDGLRGRLDYLSALGVDGIWLNPCYPSPGADHGYDVADYTGIDETYGGLPAFDRVLAEAHERGLKVLMDLVPNHCSAEHLWFQAALAGDREARARFIFTKEPNGWRSVFGGSAWTQAGDEWYLHSFDSAQPDFNWRNPEVEAHFEEALRFWFERGVDGFRIDVANMLFKPATLEGDLLLADNPEVREIHRRWRKLADSYGRDLLLVGEIHVRTPADLARYLAPGQLQQAFYFDLLRRPWDAASFRASIALGLGTIGDAITWTLANHDVHRAVSRYGLVSHTGGPPTRPRGEVDAELGVRRARAALLLMLALPGAVYLYQGEEAGLPEVLDLPDEVRQDPAWFRSEGVEHGRDGCRVPLPWTSSGPAFGFSVSPLTWLPQPEWFGGYAIEDQVGVPGSTVELHRAALEARRTIGGEVEWLPTDRDDVVIFRRGDLVCVTVFGEDPYEAPWTNPVLSSGEPLAGATTTWYRETV